MKLFFYRPIKFNPLLLIITKISQKEEIDKIESFAHDIFQMLINENKATHISIIIFSVIKDYDKTTENLILPSIKSNKALIELCNQNTKLINNIIVETLIKSDCECYFELLDNTLLINQINLNLMSLAKFYKY
jgi:hypothetical protein